MTSASNSGFGMDGTAIESILFFVHVMLRKTTCYSINHVCHLSHRFGRSGDANHVTSLEINYTRREISLGTQITFCVNIYFVSSIYNIHCPLKDGNRYEVA